MKKENRLLTVLISFALLLIFMQASAFAALGETSSGGQNSALTEVDGAEQNAADTSNCLPGGIFDLVTLDDIAENQPVVKKGPKSSSGGGAAASKNMKTMPLLMIVVGFNDTPYNDGYNWNNTIFSGSESLAKYYADNSQNKFTFAPALETSEYGAGDNTNTHDAKNDGVVHVKLDMDHDDWTHEPGGEMSQPALETWGQALSVIKRGYKAFARITARN